MLSGSEALGRGRCSQVPLGAVWGGRKGSGLTWRPRGGEGITSFPEVGGPVTAVSSRLPELYDVPMGPRGVAHSMAVASCPIWTAGPWPEMVLGFL